MASAPVIGLAKNPGRHTTMKRENVKVITIFCSIVIAGVAFAANARAQCSRETLQKLADTYVQAQTSGKATMLPLAATRVEKWDEIPQDKRDTRAAIQAAADAYLNNWGDPTLPVPHGTPCSRLEGRTSTAARNPEGQACTMGAFPQKLNVTHRRYVIDETIGAVSIFHNFPWIDAGIPTDPGTPASQTFRVEGGKNRYIHEVTVCTTANCGRGGGGPRGGQRGPGGPAAPAPAAPAAPGAK